MMLKFAEDKKVFIWGGGGGFHPSIPLKIQVYIIASFFCSN